MEQRGAVPQGIADLYAGDGASAHARIERLWPELDRSLMLRVQNILIEATHLKRSSLSAYGDFFYEGQRNGTRGSAKQTSLVSPTNVRLDLFVLAEFLSQNRCPLLGNSA